MNRYEAHIYAQSLAKAQEALEEYKLPPAPEMVWRSRDGTVRRLSEMDNNHLINTILYCERNRWRKAKIGFLRIEARRRGLL